MGIGKEIPVMCYDFSNGKFAAWVACMLSSVGLDYVMILSGGSFQDWNPRSLTVLNQSTAANGKDFEFKIK